MSSEVLYRSQIMTNFYVVRPYWTQNTQLCTGARWTSLICFRDRCCLLLFIPVITRNAVTFINQITIAVHEELNLITCKVNLQFPGV